MDSTEIRQKFVQYFHQAAEVVVRSPGRINLLGEHTDYNDGFVLPAAIDLALFVAVGRAEHKSTWVALDRADTVEASLDDLASVARHWSNYIKGVVVELQKRGLVLPDFNAVFGGNIPEGAGLSSSAALETGFLVALNTLFELGLTKLEVIQLAQAAENNFVGVNCGIMDMYANMMSKKGSVIKLDCRSLDFEQMPFEAEHFSLILCDSRVVHSLVDSEYNARRTSCEKGVEILRRHFPEVEKLRDVSPDMLQLLRAEMDTTTYKRCKYVIDEAERMKLASKALLEGDYVALGRIMYDTHKGLRTEYEVSCPELDFLVDQAKTIDGVLGARMMGGGFGGCSINLLRKSAVFQFKTEIKQRYKGQFGIELMQYDVKIDDGTSLV